MHLTLEGIDKVVGSQTWLYPMRLQPCSGAVTVLLGATQAGETIAYDKLLTAWKNGKVR